MHKKKVVFLTASILSFDNDRDYKIAHYYFQGNCLDSFARKALWDVGLDYGHGTGHGIGMYLNVHEGPMGISWRSFPDDPGLQEGMFLSDGRYSVKLYSF